MIQILEQMTAVQQMFVRCDHVETFGSEFLSRNTQLETSYCIFVFLYECVLVLFMHILCVCWREWGSAT